MARAKSYRQLEQLERFHQGCSERIAACRGTSAARAEIADLERFLSADEHLSPEQLADYRRRLDAYRRSGSEPMRQPELPLEPRTP